MEIQTQKLQKIHWRRKTRKWKRQKEDRKKPTSLNCNYNSYAKMHEIYFYLFDLGVRESSNSWIPKLVTDLYFGLYYHMLGVSTSQLKIEKHHQHEQYAKFLYVALIISTSNKLQSVKVCFFLKKYLSLQTGNRLEGLRRKAVMSTTSQESPVQESRFNTISGLNTCTTVSFVIK